MWVSRYSRSSDFPSGAPSKADQIRLFEERVEGWILRVGRDLIERDEHAGYALLNIILPYFELIAQCQEGEASQRNSRRFFTTGMRSVLGGDCPSGPVLDEFYGAARCGCFHDGLARQDVVLCGEFSEALSVDGGMFRVNPKQILARVESHFADFVQQLEGDDESVFERLKDFHVSATESAQERAVRTAGERADSDASSPDIGGTTPYSPPGASGVYTEWPDDTTGNPPS